MRPVDGPIADPGVEASARGLILTAALVLGLAVNTLGCTSTAGAGSLITYREEQSGVVARHVDLIVSTNHLATLRLEACATRFQLTTNLWKRLTGTLKRTNLHALAGSYGPTPPRPEQTTWTIFDGRSRVRITGFALPDNLKASLEPLLRDLNAVVAVGTRRLPSACLGKQAGDGATRTA